jgi:hypothetical protein
MILIENGTPDMALHLGSLDKCWIYQTKGIDNWD